MNTNIDEEEKIELIYSLPYVNIQDLIIKEENEKINKVLIIKYYKKKEYYVKELKTEEFNKKSSYLVIFICHDNIKNKREDIVTKEVLGHNKATIKNKNNNNNNGYNTNLIDTEKKKKISNIGDFNPSNKDEYENSENKCSLPVTSNYSSISIFSERLNKKNSEEKGNRNIYLFKKKMEKYFTKAYAKYIFKNKHIYFFIFNSENAHYIDRNLSIKKFLLFKNQINKNSNITLCYKNKINNNIIKSFFFIIKEICEDKEIRYTNKDIKITKQKSLELINFSSEKKKKNLKPLFVNRFKISYSNNFMKKYEMKKNIYYNYPYHKKDVNYFNINKSFLSYNKSLPNYKGSNNFRSRTFPCFYNNEKNKIKKNVEHNKLAYFKNNNSYRNYKNNVISKKKNYNDSSIELKEKKKKNNYHKKDEKSKKEHKISHLRFLNNTKRTAVLRSYPKKKKINRINIEIVRKKSNSNANNSFVEKFKNFYDPNKVLYKKKSFPFSTHDNYLYKNYFNSSHLSTHRYLSFDFYKKKENNICEKKNVCARRKNSLNNYVTHLYPPKRSTFYCSKHKRKTHNKNFEKYKYCENEINKIRNKYGNSFNRKKNYFNNNNFYKRPKFHRIKNKDNKKYFCTNNSRSITIHLRKKSPVLNYKDNSRNFLLKNKKNFDYKNYYERLKCHYNLKRKKKIFSFNNSRNSDEPNCSVMNNKYNSNKETVLKNYHVKLNKDRIFNEMNYNPVNKTGNIKKNKRSMDEFKTLKTNKEKPQNNLNKASPFSASSGYDSLTNFNKRISKGNMNLSLNLTSLRDKTSYDVNLEKLNISPNNDVPNNNIKTRKETLELIGNECNTIFQDRIFISGYKFASNKLRIEEKGITHIINAAGYECANKYENVFFYRTYYLKDDIYDDIFYTLLDSTYFIKKVLKEKEDHKILIHCNKGISRSIIIIIFFLMNELNLNYFNAFQIVKNNRTLSNPNMNYITQLLKLYNLKKTIQKICSRKGNQNINRKTANEHKIDKDDNNSSSNNKMKNYINSSSDINNKILLSNNIQIENKKDGDSYKNHDEDIVCLFIIDLEGDYLTLKKLDNLIRQDSDNDSVTLIDKRFNYIITVNFKEFYLILFDDTYESIFHSIFNHFILISRNCFGDINKTYIIRSHFMNIFKNFKIKIKIMNSITDYDKLFLNVQSFLKRVS